MAKTVGEIMDTDPETVSPDTDVEAVIASLREQRAAGRAGGERGRAAASGSSPRPTSCCPTTTETCTCPHYVNIFGGTVFLEPLRRFEERLRKAFASTAADMMTADPITVEPDTTVEDAARIVHETGHNRLPVVEHGRLVGVVTRVDLLGALVAD